MHNVEVEPDAAVGDLFMVGLPGLEIDDSTVALVRDCRIHNFILFKRNVANPDQLRKLCTALNDLCSEHDLPLPLISIDQEGGTVARLEPPFTLFADARQLADGPEPEAAVREYATICAKELREVGINMNLAPVLDVCPAGEDRFMESRSLGGDPARVGALGCLIIDILQSAGVAACVKHFPGLGAAILDPHLQLPTVSQSLQQIEEIDLLPFRAAAKAGVAAFMTSHTIYSALDAENPATLSPSILEGVLRQEVGYDGLVITDDLEMGAIENDGTVAEAAYTSFMAGADLLLICHDHEKIRHAHAQLLAGVVSGYISAVRLDASRRRISSVQQRYCVSF